MLCHQKIERALERQQIELQKTLRELRIYKKQHEQWTEVLNKIMEEQVWPLAQFSICLLLLANIIDLLVGQFNDPS